MDNFKVRIGKIIVVFSLLILLIGISLDINVSNNTYKSNGNYEILDNNEIPSTTVDNTDKDSLNTNNSGTGIDNSTNNDNNNNSISSSSSGNGNSNTTGSTNNSNSNQSYGTISDSQNTQNVVIEDPLVAAVNNLRSSIYSTYGVSVLYGSETDGYMVGGLSTNPVNNLNTIYYGLLELKQCLSLYPSDFFNEMGRNFLPLKVMFIQNYSQSNVTGITEKRSKDVIISIALDFSLKETFHHENYHYMEHYMNHQGKSYANWNLYNPTGFSYGEYKYEYVYNNDLTSEDSYFVNVYAQSADYEDRASTFEFLMGEYKISPLNYGKNIWLKGKVMCETIDAAFKSVNANTTEYWERFIY